jgi:hypothetical protein
MVTAAETHKAVLVKHGLSAPVVEEFGRMLVQYDAAVTQGNDGRTAHLGATRELEVVAQQIVRTVRVLDRPNRQRFAQAWLGASRVLGGRRSGTEPGTGPEAKETPAGGEARPAA